MNSDRFVREIERVVTIPQFKTSGPYAIRRPAWRSGQL